MQIFFEKATQMVQACPAPFLIVLLLLILILIFLLVKEFVRTMSALKRKMRAKRQAKMQEKRAVAFALPDRENAFIKERLHQVLDVVDTVIEKGKVQTAFEFLYARKLLGKLRDKPISATERLELMEMLAFFDASLQQKSWSINDLRAVNDSFSRILKLCAKYSVELPSQSTLKENGERDKVSLIKD